MIYFTTAQTKGDLQQILDLQLLNLPKNISQQEAKDQGFVTVHHDFEILEEMNNKYPHIITKDQGKVIAYALVMLSEFRNKIPVLKPMFEKIDGLTYQNHLLKDTPYFVMGQVCVDKDYRGKGIFSGLYQQMKKEMSSHFTYLITEIATRNTRSMRAHEKVGFKTIHIFEDDTEKWAIVAWDWK